MEININRTDLIKSKGKVKVEIQITSTDLKGINVDRIAKSISEVRSIQNVKNQKDEGDNHGI